MGPLSAASLVYSIYLRASVAKVNDHADELIKEATNEECFASTKYVLEGPGFV